MFNCRVLTDEAPVNSIVLPRPAEYEWRSQRNRAKQKTIR